MKHSDSAKRTWPQFDARGIRRVTEILRSGRVNYWTGDEGRLFERDFAAFLGVRHAVSVANGTVALQLALEAVGIGPGDDVVVTPYSFRASATCVNNVGANPVFADVGPDHLLTAETIAAALTPRTRAVVVVHLYGQVADLGPILRLARRRHFKVIEDCAQCLGGFYRGRAVGTLGDAGCFSFCQSKHITTGGEGGMVVSRHATVARRLVSLRDHGWKVGSSPKTFETIGTNARLTEIQSALGRVELARFNGWNRPRRARLAALYREGLSGHPLIRRLPVDTSERQASFWLMPFVLDARRLRVSVASFIEELQRRGAGCYKIMWPLMAARPQARELIRSTIGFWVHPTRTVAEVRRDIRLFRALAAEAKP